MRKTLLFVYLLLIFSTVRAAVAPVTGTKYYILQASTLSGKVIGTSQFNEVVLNDVANSSSQLFEFIPVAGKVDTYYIKNSAGYYLINSIDVKSLTEYTSTLESTNCEWMIEGVALSSVKFRVNSSGYLGTTDNSIGSMLLCDKTSTDANAVFKLVAENNMLQNNLLDGGFENAIVDGTPLGIWINDNSKTLGNDNAATQNYRSRIINNGYQSVGSNAFLLRFYGDENSYTKISYKLTGLTKGATYKFDYKYKQSNVMTADATVSSYVTLAANAASTAAISNVFTSTPPTSTAATQSAQNATLTFIASSTDCYVVFAKNPASNSNFLQYIDDMVLTKTAEAEKQIYSSVNALNFNATARTATINVTGVLLTDSIRITAPDGITLSQKALAADASNAVLNIQFTGFTSLAGNISFTSADVVKQIPLSATYTTSFVNPLHDELYFLQQRTGGKVIGKKSNSQNAALKHAEKNDITQLFQFLPVSGKSNVYYIKNVSNQFLTVASNKMEYASAVSDAAEWVLQGNSDTLVYITQAVNSAKVIGSDSIINDKLLYADKLMTNANSAFILQKGSVVNPGYMFDPSFENHAADSGPLGTWIPSNDPIQLGMYGYSRVQSSPWAATGKKCMYLRFLGDATSYTSISQKLYGLVPGATYRLDLKYKCQSTSATSLVNIYAATSVNAAKTAAIGGIYTTTVVAASNLATQAAQTTSLSFVAPESAVYIVYSKNTTATNFNFFIDDLVLTETKPSAVDKLNAPLPFNAYFTDKMIRVDFESESQADTKIELYNIQGFFLKTEHFTCTAGQNQQLINVDLPSGMYLIKLSQGGKSSVVKIVNATNLK